MPVLSVGSGTITHEKMMRKRIHIYEEMNHYFCSALHSLKENINFVVALVWGIFTEVIPKSQ